MDNIVKTASTGSVAEDRFIEIFCLALGPENTKFLYTQHPFVDIYGNNRFIDFALETDREKIAIEIDGESYHNPKIVSDNKYQDDLLKQNSLIYNGWKIYRWTYNELVKNKERVRDELLTFFSEIENFKLSEDFLPKQQGKIIELRGYQEEALTSLEEMRKNKETIGLLYHATGTGKTVTAVSDAKRMNLKTLFIAHRKEIILQAKETFEDIWQDKDVGLWFGDYRENKDIVCASIQSMVNDLEKFKEDEFGYIIIDEAHHGAAESYRKLLNYFKPEFTLGLTATPDRMDGEDLLDIFKNVSHKLDLRKAVEIGALVPVRCIRVKTSVDISDVKINGIRYNSRDLESKLFIGDRNRTIVDTYLDMVKNKKTVIFCASVKHAELIASMLLEENINARAVSAALSDRERAKILGEYENGDIDVLCACDLLNEGWDSPNTEVLFMARPTLSKTLYLQQLGRGMRRSESKEYLMVFDFIDNSNLFNTPYSIHRIFDISKYNPGSLVLGPKAMMVAERDMIYRGEKPDIYLDYPVEIRDYELVELFDWQKEVEGMVSEMEFVRMVDVQSETIRRYIREGKIRADLEIPMGSRSFFYFKEENIKSYAKEFSWDLITAANMKDKFMDYINKMDMSYSYKPVFILGFLENMNEKARVRIDDLVDYFIDYYEGRREKGLVVEKKRCLYLRDYTRSEVKSNILSNPFKRFQDMNFMDYSKELEFISLNKHILKKLDDNDIKTIVDIAEEKLCDYFGD